MFSKALGLAGESIGRGPRGDPYQGRGQLPQDAERLGQIGRVLRGGPCALS